MAADNDFIEKAVKIIMVNFGEYMANVYKASFVNKTESEIKMIVNELLEEFIGAENARQQMKNLND